MEFTVTGGSADCRSTHGGAGYAPGSYWAGDTIICGSCGAIINNPPPTGSRREYYSFKENPIKWLLGKYREIPTYPEWVGQPVGGREE